MAIEEDNITDNRYVKRRDSYVDVGVGEDVIDGESESQTYYVQRLESSVDKAVGEDRLPEEIEANFGARYIKKKKKKAKRKVRKDKIVEQDEHVAFIH